MESGNAQGKMGSLGCFKILLFFSRVFCVVDVLLKRVCGEMLIVKSHQNHCCLCHAVDDFTPVKGVDQRRYFLCKCCSLINVSKSDLLGKDEEKARYLTHQNGIEFEGYVNFLHRAIDPALNFITKDMVGLDYGCGPTPTLSQLLLRQGYACEDFDPFFVEHGLDKKFDYIFSTEAFEHFYNPDQEIQKIRELLSEKGILIIMTARWCDLEAFSTWSYARDNTHICFYHSKTFDYICQKFGFEKLFDDGQKIIILKKRGRCWDGMSLK